MNQTKKRLSIINLAISITDIETIQLQILKLRLLKTDEKIQEIVETLQEENYAHAQSLIKIYIETPNNIILQRTFQKEKERQEEKDRAVIEEFDLFTVPEEEPSEVHTIDLDDMLQMQEESSKKPTPEIEKEALDFEALLNMTSDDVMPDNIKIDLTTSASNDFWKTDASLEPDPVEKDTFFDMAPESNHTEEENSTEEKEISSDDFSHLLVQTEEEDETPEPSMPLQSTEALFTTIPEPVTEPQTETIETTEESFSPMPITPMEERIEEEPADSNTFFETLPEDELPMPVAKNLREETEEETPEVPKETTEPKHYKPIPYIDKKFQNMQVQYPSNETLSESFPSVAAWISQIAEEGYREDEIEKMIEKIETLKAEKPSEAAQLLLITAATESKYAQFQLARALFKGDILQKNLPEAFTLINRLAVNDDYPEAICDLAQFYEYGVGIEKDKGKAMNLYEEAMDLGIKRAAQHFERLQNENRGFFSFLKK